MNDNLLSRWSSLNPQQPIKEENEMRKFFSFALLALVLTFVNVTKAQTVYSDEFLRANENPLASPWTWFGGYFQLSGNLIEPQFGASNGYGGAYMYYGPTATDQFSQVTVKTANANSFVGAMVRMTSLAGGASGWYELHFYGPLGQGYIYLEKYLSTTGGSYLAYKIVTVNSGDNLKLTAVGNTLTGYINGVQVIQATDSNFPSGWSGASAYAGSLATDAQISEWYGGPLSTAPSGSLTFVAVPANSSSPCTPGQASYDQNYFYLCIAQNAWRRTPLTVF
jgi:hypothetical protein